MGQKVHPTGFRIGVIYDWQSKWFADQDYRVLLQEDITIRRYLEDLMRDAGVAKVDIERNANMITVTIHTAKPGIVIGRGGQKVDELRTQLEALTDKRIRVNIQEIRMPELDAHLVARNIADQLERRVAFRRALRQTVARTMARGAEGCKAMVAGRLGGAEMSRRETTMDGRVPLHTLRADVDYGQAEAHTTFGRIGVKVWIYKGETLPEKRTAQVIEEAPEESAEGTAEAPEAAAEHEGPAVFEVKAEPTAPSEPPAPSEPTAPSEPPAPSEPKAEAPKAEAPKAEAPKAEAPKAEAKAPEAEAEEAPAEDTEPAAMGDAEPPADEATDETKEN